MKQRSYPPLRFEGQSLQKNLEFDKNGQTVTMYNYIPDPDLVIAVNLALLLEKPLLVMGEPGSGKSLLAKAIAYDLYKENMYDYYREWHIKSTSKAQDGLYEFDNLRRLRDAYHPTSGTDLNDIDQYIDYRPMGEAFMYSTAPDKRVVLLIDEIDKADIDFPNDLLNELDKMEFEVKEKKGEEGAVISAAYRPIVIITSNAEKDLPDAFLRRCIFHYIKPLEEDKLKQIIIGRFYEDGKDDALVQKALALFIKLRKTIKDELLSIGKNISTSEFIDWFEALKYYNDARPDNQEIKQMIAELDKLDKDGQIPFSNILMKNINSVIRFGEKE